MSQELVTQSGQHVGQSLAVSGRGALAASANVGAVAIEQERAIAEARGQIQVAQMFPRDVAASRAELMDECDVFEFAQVAFYAVPRAGGTVTGPSIRLAEAVASAYGHMEWGHRELSRGDGKSEVEVYAWDKQKNNRRIRQITVDHFRDTRNGPQRLRDSKDIDDKIANVASKQMRGAILALVPKSFVEAASARCKATLAGGNGVPLKQRIEKMTDAFAKLGVSADTLKKHLKKSLSEINADDITDLTAIFNAIKGGDKIADHFGGDDDDQQDANGTGAALAASAAKSADLTAKGAKPAAKDGSKTPKNNSKASEEAAKPEALTNAQQADKPDTAKTEDAAEKADAKQDEPVTEEKEPDNAADDQSNAGAGAQEDDVF